jgi:translocation and assembly module TamA
MGRIRFIFFTAFFSFLLWSLHSTGASDLCSHVHLQEGKLKLNGNEKVLVCGSDKGGNGWKEVPLPQAQLSLQNLLQNLGYFHPRFERQNDELLVWMGPRTDILALQITGADGILDVDQKRKIKKEPLTSEKLNEVETWAQLQVRSQGYACPEIKVEGQAWNSEVWVRARPGTRKKIASVIYGDLAGLNPDALDRYRPFEIGNTYDVRKLSLMTSRMLGDSLFQSAYFVTSCDPDGENVHLSLETALGKPRIVRVNLGASTEELPFVDLSFKNSRLDDKASSITGTIHASPRLKSLNLDSELYWIPGWHRTFFAPRFRTERRSEAAFEADATKLGADIGRHWDWNGIRLTGRMGPTYNSSQTARGIGPGDSQFPTFDGSLTMASHGYEFNLRQQYEGWTSSVFYRRQSRGLGSEIEMDRFHGNFKHLWNPGPYSPPLFVLGSRLELTGLQTDREDLTDALAAISPDDRIFAGGDANLRGFPRQSLNNQSHGYQSFVYLGFELRLVEELPFHLEPFLLWDAGRLGRREFTLDSPVYVSEGAGIRWPSPFGTLRLSAARGRIFDADASSEAYPEQWVVFFSFGQEF